MPPQQQKPPKKKKKGVVGIIILVIVLVLLLLALIIGAVAIVIFSGVLKNPKKMFAENVVSITENINGEIPSIGSIPLEALFHLGVDDTQNSHTSIRTTEIMSDAMSQYDLELVRYAGDLLERLLHLARIEVDALDDEHVVGAPGNAVDAQ